MIDGLLRGSLHARLFVFIGDCFVFRQSFEDIGLKAAGGGVIILLFNPQIILFNITESISPLRPSDIHCIIDERNSSFK